MQFEDRPIHFSTELIHVPSPPQVSALQKLYFELSRTRAAYDSSDFSMPGPFRFYSRRGARTQSVGLFLPDRVVLIEEWVDLALHDFTEKIRTVCNLLPETIGVKGFLAQTVTIRTTFGLSRFEDARVFLMDHMCGQAGRIQPAFQRPVSVGGLRFVLPETPQHRGLFTVVIESFHESVREVYVEVKGVFGNQTIACDDVEPACANVQQVRDFIGARVFPYLNQYDQ